MPRLRDATIDEIENELARRSLIDFTQRTKPTYRTGWFHREVAEELDRFLQDVIDKKSPRLIITSPPQHGKSELTSRRLPAFAFGKNPELRIVGTAYSADLAESFCTDIQKIIDTPEYSAIFPASRILAENSKSVRDRRASKEFTIVGHEGTYRAVGRGGALTGRPVDCLIVDDPLKDFEEAMSETIRDSSWNWLATVALPRIQEGGGAIVMSTRWHMDDIIGRLQDREKGRWRVVNFPAIAETDEPHRKTGEPLSVERFSLETLLSIRDGGVINSYQWSALYQQRPSPAGGGIFRRDDWQFYDPDSVEDSDFEEVVQSWDCLDSETEVLCSDGWKGAGGITAGELVCSLNRDTGALMFVPVDEYRERCISPSERMVSVKNIKMNIRVTEGHQFCVLRNNRYELIPANQIVDGMNLRKRQIGHKIRHKRNRQKEEKTETYILPIAGFCEYPGCALTDDELRFVAWFMTDGGYSNQYVQIAQSKDFKNEIRDLLTRLQFDFIERVKRVTTGFSSALPSHIFLVPKGTKTGKYSRRGWDKYSPYLDKSLSPLLNSMNAEQFEIFWAELMKGDGDRQNGFLCCGLDKLLADRLQGMAVTRGRYASISHRPAKSGKEIWYVRIGMKTTTMLNRNRDDRRSAPVFEAPTHGEIVWCVSNINGTLVTRRGGKVTILGNCTFKKTSDSDFVAGHVWARLGARKYLVDRVNARMTFGETKAAIRSMAAKHPTAHRKFIEDKANGSAIIDDLKLEISGMIPVEPEGGKVARAHAVSGDVEAHNVFLPGKKNAQGVFVPLPWVHDFIEQHAAFPSGAHDDDVDACLLPDANVMCVDSRGLIRMIPINLAEPGMRVLTHQGRFRSIKNVMTRQYDGDITTIAARGGTTQTLTGNHSVLCVTNPADRTRLYFEQGEPEWKAARDVRPCDGVYESIPSSCSCHTKWDLASLDTGHQGLKNAAGIYTSSLVISEEFIRFRNGRSVPLPRHFGIDPKLSLLVGYFLGEGSLGKHSISWSFGPTESGFGEEVRDLLKCIFGVTATISMKPDRLHVSVSSVLLRRWFAMFSDIAYQKTIPLWAMEMNRDCQTELVKGMWRGDGCQTGSGFVYATASHSLSVGLRLLLGRLGIVAGVDITRKNGKIGGMIGSKHVRASRPLYLVRVFGSSASSLASLLNVPDPRREHIQKHSSDIIRNGWIQRRVREVSHRSYRGPVWNLEVEEDETYQPEGFIVHNCTQALSQIRKRKLVFMF